MWVLSTNRTGLAGPRPLLTGMAPRWALWHARSGSRLQASGMQGTDPGSRPPPAPRLGNA
eukprot:15910-Pelagomonas_calceolata.AAC.1